MRPTPILLLLAASVPALAAPQGPPYCDKKRNLEKQQEAARAARDEARAGASPDQVVAWLGDESAHVRDAVFAVLVEKKDPALLSRLEGQLGNKDELIACTVAELFAQCRYAAGRAALEKAALVCPEPVALEAVWALEALAERESAAALKKVSEKRKEPRLRGDALLALVGLEPEQARALLDKGLTDKQPMVRMAALLGLLQADPAAAVGAAVDVVAAPAGSPNERAALARLLSTALEVLRGWTSRAGQKELAARAVEALIARLGREEGLERHLVGITLEDLTGEAGLGEDPALWDGWWQARKDSWTPSDKAPAPAEPKRGKRAPKDQAGEGKDRPKTGDQGGTRVRFHGVPVRSRRLVFIQDLSGGMNNPLDKDEPDSPTKMAFAKDETVRVLGELGDDVHANALFFASEWYRAGERLMPLGKGGRARLIDFVKKQETPDGSAAQNRWKGRSNLYDTLVTALVDPEIDTVFFVSEGGPTEGRFVNEERFMRHVERLNRYQRVQVHGFLVSTSSDGARFLRKLAALTGGEFHDLAGLRQAQQEAQEEQKED